MNEGASPSQGPRPKKQCLIKTPKGLAKCSSTPKGPSRSLQFSFTDIGNSSVKISNVPKPFLRLNFLNALEKMRIKAAIMPDVKKSIVDCSDFDKKSASVIVTFTTNAIASAMLTLQSSSFMNQTIIFSGISHNRSLSPIAHKEKTIYHEETFTQNDVHEMSDDSDVHEMSDDSYVHEMSDDSDVHEKSDDNEYGMSDDDYVHQMSDIASDVLEMRDEGNEQRVIDDDNDGQEVNENEDMQEVINIVEQFKENETNNVLNVGEHVSIVINDELEVEEEVQQRLFHFSPFKSNKINREVNNNVQLPKPAVRSGTKKVSQICSSNKIIKPATHTTPPAKVSSKSKVSKKVIAHQGAMTNKVTRLLFENIQPRFNEVDFTDFLELAISKKCPGLESFDKGFKITKYEEDEAKLFVEFHSSEVAASVIENLQYISYRLEPWMVTDITPVAHEIAVPDKVTRLLFENIQPRFNEVDFTDFLELAISKKCPGLESFDKGFKITKYEEDEAKLFVEFHSSEVAASVIENLQFISYRLEPWTILNITPAAHQIAVPDKVTRLLFENIQPRFNEADFTEFLELAISKKCPGLESFDKGFKITNYVEDEAKLFVEFHSSEVAASVIENLQFISYRLEPWTVLEVEPSNLNAGGEKSSLDWGTTEEAVSSYIGPSGAVLSDEEAENAAENDELPKQLFYKALLKTRNFFKSKNNHSTGYVQILSYLDTSGVKKEKLPTIPMLNKMRRNLNNCFNTHKRNNNFSWPLYQLCCVVFDGDSPNKLSSSMYGDALIPLDPAKVCKIFTKGAVFTSESRSELIRILTENADAYRKGHMNFWSHVKTLMEEEGYFYDAGDCHDEFKELEGKYKEVESLRKRTGGPNRQYISTWEHFTAMEKFFVNDVAVNPTGTVALGTSSEVMFSESGSSTRVKFSGEMGKSRINPLKKPLSKEQKKSNWQRDIAEQLRRSNDLKERYLQKENC